MITAKIALLMWLVGLARVCEICEAHLGDKAASRLEDNVPAAAAEGKCVHCRLS